MTKKSHHNTSVFPASGNDEADSAWAQLIAERDRELLDWGTEERLCKTVHAITGKPNPSDSESAYFIAVLRSH